MDVTGNFLGRRSWLAYCCPMRLNLPARLSTYSMLARTRGHEISPRIDLSNQDLGNPHQPHIFAILFAALDGQGSWSVPSYAPGGSTAPPSSP